MVILRNLTIVSGLAVAASILVATPAKAQPAGAAAEPTPPAVTKEPRKDQPRPRKGAAPMNGGGQQPLSNAGIRADDGRPVRPAQAEPAERIQAPSALPPGAALKPGVKADDPRGVEEQRDVPQADRAR